MRWYICIMGKHVSFICFDYLRPSQQFFSHAGTGPGLNKGYADDKVSLSRTQRNDSDAHVISAITCYAYSSIKGSDKPTQAHSLSLASAFTAQSLIAWY